MILPALTLYAAQSWRRQRRGRQYRTIETISLMCWSGRQCRRSLWVTLHSVCEPSIATFFPARPPRQEQPASRIKSYYLLLPCFFCHLGLLPLQFKRLIRSERTKAALFDIMMLVSRSIEPRTGLLEPPTACAHRTSCQDTRCHNSARVPTAYLSRYQSMRGLLEVERQANCMLSGAARCTGKGKGR